MEWTGEVPAWSHKPNHSGSIPLSATNHISMEKIKKEEKKKEDKVFAALIVESIRDVVDAVHESHLTRDDLVTIIRNNSGGYVVFCYK